MNEFEKFMKRITRRGYNVIRTDKKVSGERLIAEWERGWGRTTYRILVHHISSKRVSIEDFLKFVRDFEEFYERFDSEYGIKGGYFVTHGKYDKKGFNYVLSKIDEKIRELVKIVLLKEEAIEGTVPKVGQRIPKAIRHTVWARYIGDKPTGRCYVCKKMIRFSSFDVGHNRTRAKGGYDNIDNLRPVYRDCNSAMGTITIEEFKKTYFEDLNLLPNRAE